MTRRFIVYSCRCGFYLSVGYLVLIYIFRTNSLFLLQESFITADGDVRASADVKTRNGALCMYSVYINGWIAKAAILGNK
jgi:hypothetical protein